MSCTGRPPEKHLMFEGFRELLNVIKKFWRGHPVLYATVMYGTETGS